MQVSALRFLLWEEILLHSDSGLSFSLALQLHSQPLLVHCSLDRTHHCCWGSGSAVASQAATSLALRPGGQLELEE